MNDRPIQPHADASILAPLHTERLSEAAINEQTAALAAPIARDSGALVPLLVFRAAGERFAVPAQGVERVFEVRTVRRIPHRSRAAFRGMVAHEGEILLVGSLERLLDLTMEPAADATRARMVLIGPAGRGWAFEVQAVDGVVQVRPDDMRPAPATLARGLGAATRALARIEGGDAAVLDPEILRTGWEAAAA